MKEVKEETKGGKEWERIRDRREEKEREGDVMLEGLLHGPSGISLLLTDVQHLGGMKRYQQEEFLL